MHRSRIGTVLVDHPGEHHDEHHDEALAFWAGVQGVPPVPDGPYAGVGEIGSLNLKTLEASVVEQRDGYVIMADPGGVVFCVVGVQTGNRFELEARVWP